MRHFRNKCQTISLKIFKIMHALGCTCRNSSDFESMELRVGQILVHMTRKVSYFGLTEKYSGFKMWKGKLFSQSRLGPSQSAATHIACCCRTGSTSILRLRPRQRSSPRHAWSRLPCVARQCRSMSSVTTSLQKTSI